MRVTISGGRADDRPWPNAGEPLELGDEEAADLIRGGMAYPHPDGYVVKDRQPEPEKALPLPPPVPETLAEPVPEPSDEPPPVPPSPDDPPTEAPVSYAPKQAWVDWAIAKGCPPQTARDATKAQLMEQYGARP